MPQGGLEVPCHFIFSINSAEECEQFHKRKSDSLSKTCHGEVSTESDVVGALEKVVEEKQNTSSGSNVSNSEPPATRQDSKVEVVDDKIFDSLSASELDTKQLIAAEDIIYSPPKVQIAFDEE